MRTCSVPGCKQPHKAQGYCNAHYKRFRKGADLTTPLRLNAMSKPRCKVRGCEAPTHNRGLCQVHYEHWLATGVVARSVNSQLVVPEDRRPAPTLVTKADFTAWRQERKLKRERS